MTIGKLSVLLGMNSAQFSTGMQNSANKIKDFRRDVESSTSVMRSLQSGLRTTATIAAAAGAAAAGAAYVGFRALRVEMERMDAIGKTAQKLGLLPENLVGLQHAASLAGIEQNKLDMALQRMTRRIAEAARGAGEAQGALAELRLDAARLAGVAPDVALLEIADAMAGVASQGDRVRLAFKLFDAEGVDLVRMMEGGSASIRAAMADAEQLGLTFSKFDHAQIAAANDAMTRLGLSTGILKRTLAIELAPVLSVVANQMTEWFTSGGRQAAGFSSELGGIAVAAGSIVGAFQTIAIHWTATQAVLLRGAAEIAGVLSMIPDAVKIIPGFAGLPDQETLKTAAAGLHGAFVDFNKRVNELEKADWAGDFAGRIKTMRDEIRDGLNAGRPTTDLADLPALQEQMRMMEELQRKAAQLETSLQTPAETLRARITDANKMLDLGAIGWQTYTREIQAAQKAFLDATATFSGGPQLIEKGTQASFAAADRWREMQERMRQPLPGADLIRRQPPADEIRQAVTFDIEPFPTIDVEPIEVPVTFDIQRVDLSAIPRLGRPLPEVPTLPSTLNITRVEPSPIPAGSPTPARLEREDASAIRDIPRLGRDAVGQKELQKELERLNAQTSEVIERLGTIASESRLTTNNTRDTAVGVREIQVPEIVEM